MATLRIEYPNLSHGCQHTREDGHRCMAYAPTEADFCFFHDPVHEEKRTAARKAGGIARTRKATLHVNLPTKPLRTGRDVADFLGETINQVRRGEIDLRVSNSIGYLSGILLTAIEKGSFEERLATLESVIANRPNSTGTAFDENTGFEFVPRNSL